MGKEKIIGKGLSNEILNRLLSVEVLAINKMRGAAEIVYKKDDEIGHVLIRYSIHPHPVGRYSFHISDEPLNDTAIDGTDLIYDGTETVYTKELHPRLHEITYIHNAYYWVDYKENESFEKITLLASDAQGVQYKYYLHFEVDLIDKNVYFEVGKEEAYNWFESKSLNSEDHLVISLSFNDNHITRWTITDSPNDDGSVSRLHNPVYVDTLKKKSKSKIFLNKTKEYFRLEGIGFDLLGRAHFDMFDEGDKKAFLHFADNAVAFIKNLFINRTFQNATSFECNSSEEYEKFIDSLKNKGYEMKHIYSNGEQGHPSTFDIYRFSKGDEELKLSVANDWMGWYEVNLEYDKKENGRELE